MGLGFEPDVYVYIKTECFLFYCANYYANYYTFPAAVILTGESLMRSQYFWKNALISIALSRPTTPTYFLYSDWNLSGVMAAKIFTTAGTLRLVKRPNWGCVTVKNHVLLCEDIPWDVA